MSLMVDKYRPKDLSKLDYHLDQAQHLKKLVTCGDFPHLLFYGPSGAGKNTRIMCLLRELYGPGVEKLRIETQVVTTPSKKKIELSTIASNYHIVVNPSDANIHDRIVIQEIIKTVASSQQLDPTGQKEFKVVVLTEVDRLTKGAQHALRRTMEKYVSTCRLILVGNSTSKIIPAIQSRCLGIRVPAPTHEEMHKVLKFVAKKEGLSLNEDLVNKIIKGSKRNLRRAILCLEACKIQMYPFSSDQEIVTPDWENFLKKTANKIAQEQTPNNLLQVREDIYELLTHCIPADVIFRGLLSELVKNCDGTLKCEVTKLAAYHEHRSQLGSKTIYHIEAFIASFMALYKTFMDENLADMF